MIQPSALPITPALTPVATAPVATGEAAENGQIDAGFAALLGLRLEATAGEEKQLAPLTAVLAPQVAPAKASTDGEAVPGVLPQIHATENEEEPAQEGTDNNVIEPVFAALPVFQSATPAETPAPLQQRSAPQSTAPAPFPIKAAVSREPSMPPAPAGAEGRAEPVPQRALTVPEETSRPAKAEPVRAIAAAPQAEVSATPAATFQPVVTAPQPAPASTVASQPHARHDFAALVDRLVEARDTALTVQTPQSIAAAIRHSDFGDVSIRFEHRGDMLSVSLSNADPDFTRAVQAATTAAQTNTSGDGAQPQRHDASGQQSTAGSGNSHQSQPQQRQGSASSRNPVQQQPDGEPQQQSTPGSIFA